ncbi:MAG: signal peptide peptidase SppA [Rikenellaceae bacterium]
MGIFFKRFFATILGFLTAVIIFIIGAAALLYFCAMALTPSARVINKGTVLEIDMEQQITDAPQPLNISQLLSLTKSKSEPSTLYNVIKALDRAATDPNIAAISLKMSGNSPISLANGEELRNALLKFKESDKPLLAFAESASQLEYYVASAADFVALAPLGAIEWQGVAINTMFYTQLMNQLGIKAEVFRPTNCTYKSAIEPFTRTNMSNESREQSERLVAGFWNGIVAEVAEGRNISEAKVKELAFESILLDSKLALESNFIDLIAYADQYDERLIEAGAIRSKSDDSTSEERKGEIRKISLSSYIKAMNNAEQASKSDIKSNLSNIDVDLTFGLGAEKLGDKIAIIYAEGAITDGESNATENNVGAATLIAQLREARANKEYRAVIVRVNSPGGSALASDNIWREMELLKERKTVVISMGSYAASGGYYISAPAHLIVADRFTLTGSIGVYGIMINAEEALRNKLHINQQSVTSSPSADFGRVTRPITALERAAVMRGVDEVYNAFIDRVAIGRKLSPAIIKALAGGRVWSGEEAASCNLVDEIGGLSEAIEAATNHSGADISKREIIEIAPQENTPWMEYASLFSATIASHIAAPLSLFSKIATKGYEGDMMRDLKAINSADRGIVMIAPERIQF